MTSGFIISVIAMGGLSIFFAAFLVMASKKFKVEEDPMVEKILSFLPNTNCGACGYAGCQSLAEKLANKEAAVNACTAGGQDVADAVASALGLDSVKASRVLAVVLCRGGFNEAERISEYRGDLTCAGANLTGGEKSCAYSCLGYADCVTACKFDAIGMNDNGLPVVFYDNCIGCGACAKACPRSIIEMHPEEHKLFVYCRNRDKGPQAKKMCKVSCIACTLCTKDCKTPGGIAMVDNLATVNYELCPQTDESTKRCPTKCIAFDEEKANTQSAFYAARLNKASGQ